MIMIYDLRWSQGDLVYSADVQYCSEYNASCVAVIICVFTKRNEIIRNMRETVWIINKKTRTSCNLYSGVRYNNAFFENDVQTRRT